MSRSIEVETAARLTIDDRVRFPPEDNHPSSLTPSYVFRLLESGAYEDAATVLSTYSPRELWPGGISVLAREIVAHGIDRAWFTSVSDAQLCGKNLNWWDWMSACGAYANPSNAGRMAALLAKARENWPAYSPYLGVLEALRKSRMEDHAGALATLGDPAVAQVSLTFYPVMRCEILSRPIFRKALGDRSAAGAADACMHPPGPTHDPLAQDYWARMQAGDLDGATRVSEKLFWRSPEFPFWSLVPVWNAARKGDQAALAAGLERAQIACRHNRPGLWPMTEMAAIETRFLAR